MLKYDENLTWRTRATAKRFVDHIAQPSVIRLVHRQHMVDEGPQDARYPPLESLTRFRPQAHRVSAWEFPILLRGNAL
jgi:hypothetical protein